MVAANLVDEIERRVAELSVTGGSKAHLPVQLKTKTLANEGGDSPVRTGVVLVCPRL